MAEMKELGTAAHCGGNELGTDQMGPKGKLDEVKSDESGKKERGTSGNDWRETVRAGKCSEVYIYITGFSISGDDSMQEVAAKIAWVYIHLQLSELEHSEEYVS